MFFFYKVLNGLAPQYLTDYIPNRNMALRTTRSRLPVYPLNARTERYRNTFFPFCISQWNSLDSRLRDLPSLSCFKSALFEFFRPKSSPTFRIDDHRGFILLTRLRVGFSHLREHKFRHGFQDTLDPFCSCRTNSIETTEHYLLHCSNYTNQRLTLMNGLQQHNIDVLHLSPSVLCKLLLYGDPNFTDISNYRLLKISIEFILGTNRFSGPLF